MDKSDRVSEKEVLTLAWNYFQQHAQQRLGYIDFFIVISSALTIAQCSILSTVNGIYFVVILIGLIQYVISYIFYKFDERNKFLTKYAEGVIKAIESKYSFDDSKEYMGQLKLFTNEDIETEIVRTEKKLLTHSQCYKFLLKFYCIIATLAIILAILFMLNVISLQSQNMPNSHIEINVY